MCVDIFMANKFNKVLRVNSRVCCAPAPGSGWCCCVGVRA
jgi:hypothetical protein